MDKGFIIALKDGYGPGARRFYFGGTFISGREQHPRPEPWPTDLAKAEVYDTLGDVYKTLAKVFGPSGFGRYGDLEIYRVAAEMLVSLGPKVD